MLTYRGKERWSCLCLTLTDRETHSQVCLCFLPERTTTDRIASSAVDSSSRILCKRRVIRQHYQGDRGIFSLHVHQGPWRCLQKPKAHEIRRAFPSVLIQLLAPDIKVDINLLTALAKVLRIFLQRLAYEGLCLERDSDVRR